MTTPFWINNPTILFTKDQLLELWPTQQMTFESKLNAISRVVIAMSLVGFIFTKNWNLLIIGFITLAIIVAVYKLRKQNLKEKFSLNKLKPAPTDNIITNPATLEQTLRSNFHPTTKKNPCCLSAKVFKISGRFKSSNVLIFLGIRRRAIETAPC